MISYIIIYDYIDIIYNIRLYSIL